MSESRIHAAAANRTGNGAGDHDGMQDLQSAATEQEHNTTSPGAADGDMRTTMDATMNTEGAENQQHETAGDAESLQEQLQAARQSADENWNKLVRLQAEMDNLRKRTSRDIESAHKFALEKFVAELLPVIDSLELGINAADTSGDAESLREGMVLTLQKFQDVIGKFGVEEIDPLGKKFTPELHEAVSMQESEDAESGTVITVMQKGYTLNQRLIRPAMVVVAK